MASVRAGDSHASCDCSFRAKYKGKVVKRIFEKNAPSASTIANSSSTLLKSLGSGPSTSG